MAPGGYHAFSIPSVNNAAYPGAAQVAPGFSILGVRLHNRGANPIIFSFDGVNDHGRLETTEAVQLPDILVSQIWLRRDGAGGANSVEVTTWG